MKLTCVTATFNCIKAGNRDRLIRCVESVAKLKTGHEHLIYDGASTDGTVELLRELEAKTPGLKVVSEPDTGIYNALNKGVRDAQGEWFYVLGADDYIMNVQYFDRVLREAEESTSVIVAPVARDDGMVLFEKESDLANIFFGYPYSHQGVVMKSEVVRRYGGFNERYLTCADWNLFLLCHKAGEPHQYVYRPFTFYAEGGFSEDPRNVWIVRRGFDETRRNTLGLTEQAYARFRQRGFPGISTIIWLLVHPDLAFKLSGRRMFFNMLRFYMKIAFYPLVLIRRNILSKRMRGVAHD